MRLCFIANANSSNTRKFVEPLIARGDDVYLFTYQSANRPYPGIHALVDLTRRLNIPKIRWLIWGIYLRKTVHDIKPDVVHSHQITAAGWLGVMTQYHPFVITSWGSDLLIEPQKSFFRRSLVQVALKQCDRLIVPSPELETVAREMGTRTQKIRFVPWGIDSRIFNTMINDRDQTRDGLGIDKDSQVVFCPRAIKPLYNIDILISAVANLVQDYPRVQLLLIQFNPEPDYFIELQKRIRREGLEPRVHWIPAQDSPEAMARIYRASDIVVSIPKSDGYALSILEAMACGVPTLITDLPAYQNDLLHNEHTIKVAVSDIASTTAALSNLLTDTDLRLRLKENAQQIVMQRTEQSYLTKTDQVYQELIGALEPE